MKPTKGLPSTPKISTANHLQFEEREAMKDELRRLFDD